MLKKRKENLRKKKENREGTQYQSKVGLQVEFETVNSGTCPLQEDLSGSDGIHYPNPMVDFTPYVSTEGICIIFFDLETTGFGKSAGILQIAASITNSEFSLYVNPTQRVPVEATNVHGLENRNGELFRNGTKVNSVPLVEALRQFHHFLVSLQTPTILVAHNAGFDSTILCQAIKNTETEHHFAGVIVGFADTLSFFRHKLPYRKGPGVFKLSVFFELAHSQKK